MNADTLMNIKAPEGEPPSSTPSLHSRTCRQTPDDLAAMSAVLARDPEALHRLDCTSHLYRPKFALRSNTSLCPPIVSAVLAGHTTCVQFLLKAGADPNASDDFQRTTLYFSITNRNAENMEILLANKANPDYETSNEEMQRERGKCWHLSVACQHAFAEGVRLLLEHGALPEDLTTISDIRNPAVEAITSFSPDCLKLCLVYGATPDYHTIVGFDHDKLIISSNEVSVRQLLVTCLRFCNAKRAFKLFHEFGASLWDVNEDGENVLESLFKGIDAKSSVASHRSFHETVIKEVLWQPRSLQSLARITVHRSMDKRKYVDNVPCLNLPARLKEFLKFTDD